MKGFNNYTEREEFSIFKNSFGSWTMQGNEEKRIFCGTRHCHDTCRLCREGMFRYVCTDENGCEHIVGYAFAGEYVGDYPQCIKKIKQW